MRIAAEGRPFVAIGILVLAALGAAAGTVGGWWWIGPAAWLPIAAWIPWFFRDPPRPGPRGDDRIIAPADGRIVSVGEVEEPDVIRGRALRVSIFMNVFNVHVNRYPASGEITHRDYHPGAFVNATLDKASVHNERMSLGLRSARGPIMVRQIAGLIARRIVTDDPVGAQVQQGDRLGIIRFGSRVDTFLPPGVRPLVSVGDHTVAGVTVIAEWPS